MLYRRSFEIASLTGRYFSNVSERQRRKIVRAIDKPKGIKYISRMLFRNP